MVLPCYSLFLKNNDCTFQLTLLKSFIILKSKLSYIKKKKLSRTLNNYSALFLVVLTSQIHTWASTHTNTDCITVYIMYEKQYLLL